jgi:hypothetical protein
MAKSSKAERWVCIGRADDGEEMQMGWEVSSEDEAVELMEDVIWHRDLPADRLEVRRLG